MGGARRLDVARSDREERAVEVVRRRFEAMRLRPIARPLDEKGRELNPQLPSDLTSLNNHQLGKLYGQFALMAQYAQFHLAVHSVMRAEDEQKRKVTRAKVKLLKKGRVVDLEPQTEVDPKTREAEHEALISEGVYIMTKSALEGFLLGKEVCSREMTRRGFLEADPNARR